MKFSVVAAFLGIFLATGTAIAKKPPGASCHVHKSCSTNLCVRQQPTDKFGTCCAPQSCPELGAQCGLIDNGCGIPIDCATCDPSSLCIDNMCVTTTTTTTTTSTTSTTTTTLGCIANEASCPSVESDDCCNGSCVNVEAGPTGHICISCVPLGVSCTIGGSICCGGGTCASEEGVMICVP